MSCFDIEDFGSKLVSLAIASPTYLLVCGKNT